MNQLHKTRYEMMWQEYENFTKKSVANFDFPNYDSETKTTNPLDEYIIDGDDGE